MKRLRLLVPALVVTVSAAVVPAAVADSPYPGIDFLGCDGIRAQQGRTFTDDAGYHAYVGDFTAGEQLLVRPAAPGASYAVRTPFDDSQSYPGGADAFRYDVAETGRYKFAIFAHSGALDEPLVLTHTATCGVPPTVTITNPTAAGVAGSGEAVVRASFSCADGTNPVATCTSSPEIPLTRPGTHTFSVTATDTQGLATTRSVTYTVPRLGQSVAFTTEAPAGATWGRTPYAVGARSTSGLPVAITVDPASTGCTASSGVGAPTVSFPRPGPCILHADQPGNDTYLPAPRVSQTFEVGRRATYLTATKASKGLLGLTPTTFRAELDADQLIGSRWVAAGYPGQDVTFWVDGKAMCSATSVAVVGDDSSALDAVATCKAPIGLANVTRSTYTVTFGGNDLYLPSSAVGVLR